MEPEFTSNLPPLKKPRYTSTHLVRWLAAQQNWHKIHHDQHFCESAAKLTAPVINGALKQHLIVQFLEQALPSCWPWKIRFQFRRPDFVGDKLIVQGRITERQVQADQKQLSVAVEILNVDRSEVTTLGTATVLAPRQAPLCDALHMPVGEDMSALKPLARPDGPTDEDINRHIGKRIDSRASVYPLDLSRLRLFADAVMGLPAHYFDPDIAVDAPWGGVVAPPLFPLHGLEDRPGKYPLSEDPLADGREGVNEAGRDLGRRFGISTSGGMNAGNQVEIHSLARVGERIKVDSVLVGAARRRGRQGGDMIFFETMNQYATTTGRRLVTERQSTVLRLVDDATNRL